MQYKEVAGGICAPKGFAAAGVHCGIRANHSEKYDLALIKAEVRCAAAGVYTTNKVCGAPIKVDRAHLTDGYAQAIVVNSGNANTCAANGVALAEECCALVGKALNIDEKDVLPASTGVIGQPMVIDPFARGIPAAAEKLAATAQGSTDAATAIMTTDTHKKEYAIQFELGGKVCTVGAIGKGSGMIAPNMATMLAFYTTDAAVSPALLEKALKTVVPGTYNQMSVDLDTSTNDTLIIMASGLAGNPEICEENADYAAFVAALTAIAQKGEGSASKGRIVLATVKGDVHDIGKNIVRVILENYGFEVLDLGRDVPVETVVDTVREKDVHLVGLSALMTTTLKSMEETIAALHAAQLDCKIMVGGAVLTPEYAEKIGADWYAKDAKRSADIAKEFFGV